MYANLSKLLYCVGKYFKVNPKEKDGNEKFLRILLISSAIAPIFFLFGVIFIIHSEFHVGAIIKWVLIWLANTAGFEDNSLAYYAALFSASGFAGVSFSLDLFAVYHLMVICVIAARGGRQFLQALTRQGFFT